MATLNPMVRTVGVTAPQDDQSWLVNRMSDGIKEGQLDLALFTGDEEAEAKYFASIDPDDTDAWLKSGIPVARVNGTNTYGPYDPAATDGRQSKVAGFLESQLHVVFTRTGFENRYPTVGIRYMAVIDANNLPVDLPAGTQFDGLVLDYDKDAGSDVTVLSAGSGAANGPAIPADGSISTVKLADGAVTPAKLSGYDPADGQGKTVRVKADGSGFDFADDAEQTTIPQGALIPGAGIDLERGDDGVITASVKAKGITAAMIADGVIPAAYVLPAAGDQLGGVKRAAQVADLAAGADAAAIVTTVNALLASLRASGVLAPKE